MNYPAQSIISYMQKPWNPGDIREEQMRATADINNAYITCGVLNDQEENILVKALAVEARNALRRVAKTLAGAWGEGFAPVEGGAPPARRWQVCLPADIVDLGELEPASDPEDSLVKSACRLCENDIVISPLAVQRESDTLPNPVMPVCYACAYEARAMTDRTVVEILQSGVIDGGIAARLLDWLHARGYAEDLQVEKPGLEIPVQ